MIFKLGGGTLPALGTGWAMRLATKRNGTFGTEGKEKWNTLNAQEHYPEGEIGVSGVRY